jgi:hypothetical protein
VGGTRALNSRCVGRCIALVYGIVWRGVTFLGVQISSCPLVALSCLFMDAFGINIADARSPVALPQTWTFGTKSSMRIWREMTRSRKNFATEAGECLRFGSVKSTGNILQNWPDV